MIAIISTDSSASSGAVTDGTCKSYRAKTLVLQTMPDTKKAARTLIQQ